MQQPLRPPLPSLPLPQQQYISAVEFLHANQVAHRDLKLDNIVLDGRNPPRIKVCDFGFSKHWDKDAQMYTQVRVGAGMRVEGARTR